MPVVSPCSPPFVIFPPCYMFTYCRVNSVPRCNYLVCCACSVPTFHARLRVCLKIRSHPPHDFSTCHLFFCYALHIPKRHGNTENTTSPLFPHPVSTVLTALQPPLIPMPPYLHASQCVCTYESIVLISVYTRVDKYFMCVIIVSLVMRMGILLYTIFCKCQPLLLQKFT